MVNTTRYCEECSAAGKNDKVLQKQSEFGKIPDSPEPNEEIALDFAGPSQNAKHGKQYLLVTLYNFSAWPDAICLHKATTEKVIEFFKKYIAQYGIPKRIRSDPGAVFMKKQLMRFCKQCLIQHVTCPVRDHRVNGKIERLIRTLNERLHTNKTQMMNKDNSGWAEILCALKTGKKMDGISPFERQYSREPNTVKSNIVSELGNKEKGVSEQDPKFSFVESDCKEEVDSTILVRERARGSNLESAFQKKK